MKPRWIVVDSKSHAQDVVWENEALFFNLDEARCEMHERAARMDNPVTLVAVFPNTPKAIQDNRWNVQIDRRDKSAWPRWEHCCDCGAYFWSTEQHKCRLEERRNER